MKAIVKKTLQRKRRKARVRKHVFGTADRPRLTVFRSHKNIYAQIIDDTAGHTMVSASTTVESESSGGNKAAAKVVGTSLAAKAIEAGIKKVVFDRNGYNYHGRVQELANAAREGGLEF